MGQASSFFPTSVLDCKTTDQASVGSDGRFDYQCSSDSTVRAGLTLLHLLTLVVVLLAALLLYRVYLRVCARRLHARLRAQPLKRLPLAQASRRVQLAWARDFARVSGAACVPAPPPRRRRRAVAAAHAASGTAEDAAARARRRATVVAVRERLLGLAAEFSAALQALLSADERSQLAGGLSRLAPTLEARYGVDPAEVLLLAEAFDAAHASLLAEPAWYDDARARSAAAAAADDGGGDDAWADGDEDDRFTDAELSRVLEAAERCVRGIVDGAAGGEHGDGGDTTGSGGAASGDESAGAAQAWAPPQRASTPGRVARAARAAMHAPAGDRLEGMDVAHSS